MLKFWEAERPTPKLAAVTGLALAAAFLTKISNLPLLAVAGIFLLLKWFRLAAAGTWCPALPALGTLAACAALPMIAWMTWCKVVFGDFTGSGLKIQFLGWTNKPLAEWFQHPLFTPRGFWTFVSGNLASFWQGELLWQRQPLALPAMNWFYVLLTLALGLGLLIALLKRQNSFSTPQRTAIGLGFACLIAAFVFFGLLSVKYDFQNCFIRPANIRFSRRAD